ncbi:MAG: hypothetical protein K2J20_01700, partial [Bacilli bacterium]|nr:hypothetical protein [Bacilli bacterium]
MKKKILILVLIVLIVGITVGVVVSLQNNKKKYASYEVFENIELIDGTRWQVIKKSDENSDYVTALALDYYDEINDETYQTLDNELFSNVKISYDNSESKKYVDSLKDKFKVKLKEVDVYQIRLLKLEEL